MWEIGRVTILSSNWEDSIAVLLKLELDYEADKRELGIL